MQTLPVQLRGLTNAIERAVQLFAYNLPQLSDKDVIWAYTEYVNYFKAVASGSDRSEPSATARHKDLLLEYIWETLLKREDLQLDDPLVGGIGIDPTGQAVSSLEHLYVLAFRWLRTSARNTKEKGNPRAYLQLLEETAPNRPLTGGFDSLTYLQVKYGVAVKNADRKGSPTTIRDLRTIETPENFLAGAEANEMPLYLHEAVRLLDGTVYRSDVVDFSLVAIRLALLRGENEQVFRLAEDLLSAGFDTDTLGKLDDWFLRDIGTRLPIEPHRQGIPRWGKAYAARYPAGVRLVQIWSMQHRLAVNKAELERMLAEGIGEEE